MTSADKRRVRKALDGASFPADKQELFRYASERSADAETREALEALPDGQYESIDQVERSVPQRPSEHATEAFPDER